MKRLITVIALAVLGACFAADGYCIGIGPIGDLIDNGLFDGAAVIPSDPCARVRNHLRNTANSSCPPGTSCVNMSATVEYVDTPEGHACKLTSSAISLSTNDPTNEHFNGVGTDGSVSELLDVTINDGNLDFAYIMESASDFVEYNHYEISYCGRFGCGWLGRIYHKRIVFVSPPTPSSGGGGSGGGGGGSGGGDDDEAGEGPVGGGGGGEGGGGEGGGGGDGGGGGGEGEVTDLCASVACLEGQTCDPATGACVAVVILPADLCAGVTCPEGQVCQASTGACVAAPPPPDLCASMICPSGQSCVNGACAAQIGPLRRAGDGNQDESMFGLLDTSEGGCQLSPYATSSASGAPYLWLTIAGIALTIARRRLLRR